MFSIQITLQLCIASFALLCAIITFISRKDEPLRSFYIIGLLILGILNLTSDTLALCFDGNPSHLGFFVTHFSTAILFLSYPLMFIFVTRFLQRLIEFHGLTFKTVWIKIMDSICIFHMLLILLSQFTGLLYYFDSHNEYFRSNGYFLLTLTGIVELLLLMIIILHNWKPLSRFEAIALLCFIVLPFCINIIEFFYNKFSLAEFTSCLCTILLFMFNEVEKTSRLLGQNQLLEEHKNALQQKEQELTEQKKVLSLQEQKLIKKEAALNLAFAISNLFKDQLLEKEQQLSDAHVQISVSQIQPHFIFNALGSIEQLCRINPPLAAEATHQFAHYLRNNLLALSNYELEDFLEEHSHIQTYIWLEKMRFGEDLCYTEDLQVTNFQVPVLSVQPLVENAVKHGMMGTGEGILHVSLKTWEEPDCYCIRIQDDGGGFDPEKLPTDSRVHVGLANVRNRLERMCNGQLVIESQIGKGSTFTLVIPKNN